MYRKFFKRFFDIVMSFMGIIMLALPMLIIAIMVKCDSKGPAIFKHERVGRNCKLFKFYKFRSMSTQAPRDCATREIESQAYITKIGKVLRKTSLDELPQLFNILKGNMSFIGPRPVVPSEFELIEARKLTGAYNVRGGLTGLAQISGRDKVTDMQFKAELDGTYAKKITFKKDLRIFLTTFIKVLRHDGIQEGSKTVTVSMALPEFSPGFNQAALELASTSSISQEPSMQEGLSPSATALSAIELKPEEVLLSESTQPTRVNLKATKAIDKVISEKESYNKDGHSTAQSA